MHETTLTPKLRDFACRLIILEKEAENSANGGPLAVLRVCDRLQRPLSKLMGRTAFTALLSRALTLAKAETPCLNAVKITDDASLAGLDAMETERPEEWAEAEIVLVAHFIGLLVTFIGKGLTVKLTQYIWPDVSFDNLNSEKKGNDESPR